MRLGKFLLFSLALSFLTPFSLSLRNLQQKYSNKKCIQKQQQKPPGKVSVWLNLWCESCCQFEILFYKKKQARSVENRKYKSKTEKMLNKRLKI